MWTANECRITLEHQLAVGVTFYMVLIPEMPFAVLLCLVCVYVFLSEFTFVFGLFPFLGNLTVFDFFVLVPCCFSVVVRQRTLRQLSYLCG